jgi:hypothetical protein
MAVPAAVAIALTLWLFVDRMAGAQMREPLTWDEMLNLENYSWATFQTNGLPTHADRAEDMLPVQRPNAMQLIAGVYRAISVWREPNDHIVHSVLVNLSTALSPGGEAAVRFPAWAGALMFAAALAWLAWRSGHRLAWPLALLVGASWPYVHIYSLQARGYSWMLALQAVLLLLLADALPRRPSSIVWGALCGLVAILSFSNMVNLIVDWLAPLYLALWLFPPRIQEAAGSVWKELSPEDLRAYRQNLSAFSSCSSLFISFPTSWFRCRSSASPRTDSTSSLAYWTCFYTCSRIRSGDSSALRVLSGGSSCGAIPERVTSGRFASSRLSSALPTSW